jgi:hypothetical protein
MDKLKDYVCKNKARLDIHEPPVRKWTAQQINSKKTSPAVILMARRSVAACVLVLAGFGIYFLLAVYKQEKSLLTNETIKMEVVDFPTEALLGKQQQVVADTPVPAKKQTHTSTFLNHAFRKPKGERAAPASDHITSLQEIEKKFDKLINMHVSQINATPVYAEDSSYFNTYKRGLQQFTSMQNTLKNELQLYGVYETKLEAMVSIYKKKIELLERLQEEIRRMNRFALSKENKNYLNL